ncbi:ABC transporter permease [Jiangella anatolica]|uniref:Peptide ABC transporter permease n=1 Tax=Jiangella anatolica TaxID=2670374 RepID=A0A2W2CNV9_9ACTN|nr:ABC transporter permease [Jiangella anatolica]PZF81923.1 peptide ABC transporter permease [Jiangella anatolica]
MTAYVARRLLLLVPTLLALTVLAFLFVRALPGDAAVAILGPNASAESIERLRETLGLNLPLPQQYGEYLAGLLSGDLGTSAVSQRPIAGEIGARLPATIELSVAALLIGVPLGIALGRFSARRAGSAADATSTVVAVVAVSVPVFVLGLTLQYVFAVLLNWFPAIGRVTNSGAEERITGFVLLDAILSGRPDLLLDGLHHLVLPAVTLAAVPMAVTARIARAAYLAESRRPHVRIALAKGLAPAKVRRDHIAHNSWPPLVVVIGLQLGALLSGGIITENIFGWGGLGSLVVSSIRTRDYLVIQSGLLVLALIYVLVNMAVDVVNARIDPRLRSAR